MADGNRKYYKLLMGRDISGYDDPLSQVPTSTEFENSMRCKPEVETVPQTGSTNNLTTETDIDAISVAIPMF